MRVIVAGSRNYPDCNREVNEMLDAEISENDIIISGGANGPDTAAIDYAISHGIRCHIYPAKWALHGKSAGMIRNTDMAYHGDRLIAFYNKSPGTRNMIDRMISLGKPVLIVRPRIRDRICLESACSPK
jgi:hypothetical protein